MAMETEWNETLQRLEEKATIFDFRAMKEELSTAAFPEYPEIADFRIRATAIESQWEETLQRLSEKAEAMIKIYDFRGSKDELSRVVFPLYPEIAEFRNRATAMEMEWDQIMQRLVGLVVVQFGTSYQALQL